MEYDFLNEQVVKIEDKKSLTFLNFEHLFHEIKES